MISKQDQRKIESLLSSASDPTNPPAKRLEMFFEAILLQKMALIDSISKVRRMWDTAGMQAILDAAEDTEALGDGGTYTVGFIKVQQLVFLSYEQWLTSAVSAVIDGETITGQVPPIWLFENQPQKVSQVVEELPE